MNELELDRPTRRPAELDHEPWLRWRYIELRQSARRIAEELGCGHASVLNALRHHGIPVRQQTSPPNQLGRKDTPKTTAARKAGQKRRRERERRARQSDPERRAEQAADRKRAKAEREKERERRRLERAEAHRKQVREEHHARARARRAEAMEKLQDREWLIAAAAKYDMFVLSERLGLPLLTVRDHVRALNGYANGHHGSVFDDRLIVESRHDAYSIRI